MNIEPGRYKTAGERIVIIETKQEYPIPAWRGYIEGQGEQRSMWTEDGKELSGYKRWDLIERIEKKGAIIEGD